MKYRARVTTACLLIVLASTAHAQKYMRITLPTWSSLRDISHRLCFRAGGVTVLLSPNLRSRHG
jgi:hypothetical protein